MRELLPDRRGLLELAELHAGRGCHRPDLPGVLHEEPATGVTQLRLEVGYGLGRL